MPKGTPIPSFSQGKIVRVKEWDGNSEDEGNCVVVQSGNLFWSYLYLDSVDVEVGQEISKSTVV